MFHTIHSGAFHPANRVVYRTFDKVYQSTLPCLAVFHQQLPIKIAANELPVISWMLFPHSVPENNLAGAGFFLDVCVCGGGRLVVWCEGMKESKFIILAEKL